MHDMLGYGSLAVYFASFLCYAWLLYDERPWVGHAATGLLAAGIVLHYFALLERSRWTHTIPYDDLYGSMSLFAWLVAVTYLGLELFHHQRGAGPFVLVFLLLWLGMATALGPATPASPAPARGPMLALHITMEVLGYAAFGLSFIFSMIYLGENRVLRTRKPGRAFWKLPALDVLERMAASSVKVGVGALVVGTALGLAWERRLSGSYVSHDPKVIATVLIVAMYSIYLWLARNTAWRGARAARLCALNFLVVIFSYTLVNLYLTTFHRYF
jgi:HemX protein